MRTVALISGGKDSCYNMMQCISEGHEIVALANLQPKDKDELDSYMYQTVGHHAIHFYAKAVGLPLYRHTIQGTSSSINRDYQPTQGDEVEDLYTLLNKIKEELQIEAVSVGAILSDYQRVRVENVCQRLGLTSLAYLWQRDQSELLKEMIDSGLSAILIKVASMGLNPKKHLGKTLKELYPKLLTMNKEFQLNVCGEGGEYETFTTDCPVFNRYIVLDSTEEIVHSDDAFAPVGYLNLKNAHLEDKDLDLNISLSERLRQYPLKRSSDIHKELFTDDEVTSLSQTDTNRDYSEYICKCSESPKISIKQNNTEIWVTGVTVEMDNEKPIEELTKVAMEKLKECLNSLEGWSLDNLCMIHLYVRDLDDFLSVNSVYKTYFGLNPPSRVCVQVPLPENIALQLDCYGNCDTDRHTMHVQSISHWAPANIGPYSQAVKVNQRLYVAGQIAMVPSTLQIISGGIKAEARLSLRHIDRILKAMPGNVCLKNISMAICYVTSREYIPLVKEEWKQARSKAEEDKLSNFTSTLTEFVVVPRLPRNAKIEWQVYADVNITQLTGDKVEIRHDLLHSVGNYRVNDNILSCTIKVDTTFVQTVVPDVTDVVSCFCQCYSKIIDQSNTDSKLLPALRIFYPVLSFDFDAITKELKNQLNKDVIYTVIPVISLYTSTTVLLGCH